MVRMYQEAKPAQSASMYGNICKFWLKLAANPELKVSTQLLIHFLLGSFVCELINPLRPLTGKSRFLMESFVFLAVQYTNTYNIKRCSLFLLLPLLFLLVQCSVPEKTAFRA
jgi:hypothetical protein